jgi:heme oxygenase
LNIDEQFAQINAKVDALTKDLHESEERIVEHMRDMQTEILRGFGTWSENQSIRLTKVEADHRNLDVSSTMRLANLEHRLLEIEKRLLMEPPK